jgi:hypothetical protein
MRHRWLAVSFAMCATATATLLVNHPSGAAGTFADTLRTQASHQLADALVHGGFILTLCALMVCFTIWSRMLGSHRVAVVVGMVSFCAGCGALLASMILDGFVSPALAARFVAADPAEGLGVARPLLILCGTLIRFLMPWGLALQSVAMFSWSLVLLRMGGIARAVGTLGVICAVTVLTVFLAFTKLSAHLLPAVILVHVFWYAGLAVSVASTGKALSPPGQGL